MSKAHRGTGLRKTLNHGRGTCPICKTTGIKTVYEYELDGKKVQICKFCKANLKNKARAERRLQVPPLLPQQKQPRPLKPPPKRNRIRKRRLIVLLH